MLQQPSNTLLSIYLLALDNDLALYEQTLISNIQAGTVDKFDRVALVVIDGNGPHDTRVEIIQNGNIFPLSGLPNQLGIVQPDLDEYDMTDGATLGGLLKWARQSYSATQSLLTFVGHGLPAAPVADVDRLWPRQLTATQLTTADNSIPLPTKYWAHPNYTDNNPKRTVITPKQLGIALAYATDNGVAPLTVLDLVHCFGATIEELYEVAPYVLATVGSPSYAFLKPETLKLSLLGLPTNLAAVDLAKQLATYHQIEEPNHPTVITTVDNSRLAAVQSAWNQVSGALLQRLQQEPTTRERLVLAWRQAGKYDAPLCDDEWRIDETDYLVDLGSFARTLQDVFPGEPVAFHAQQVLTALNAAATTLIHSDHPWMLPEQFWNFDSTYVGIALYGNLIPLIQNDQTYLSFQGHFYDSTALEIPYRFIQRREDNDITWADLFTTFWRGQSVQTVACLPALRVTSGSNADLGLLIELPQTPITILDNLTYTVAIHNIGSILADNVTLYPSVPATVTLLAIDPRCATLNGVINCQLGAIAPATSLTVTLVVKPSHVGNLVFQALVTSTTPENDLSNNEGDAALSVQPARSCTTLDSQEPCVSDREETDHIAPVITGSRTPDANANGWNNSAVTVSFTCADNVDGVGLAINRVAGTILSSEGANQTVTNTGDCIDKANNSAATVTLGAINIDLTKPTISASATNAPNANGWYNRDVTVHSTCVDALSGLAPDACPPDQLLSTEGNAVTARAQVVVDRAENTSDPSNIVTVKLDKSAPIVVVTMVNNGASYTIGSVPTVGCSTTDTLSAVATPATLSVTGSNRDGIGSFTATCRGATDNAGNSAAAVSVTYTVQGLFIDSCGGYMVYQAGGRYVVPGWNGTIKLGTSGNNTLIGTEGPDLMLGLGGNDLLSGAGGDDLLCGGAGVDLLQGLAGNDILDGGAGNDVLNGGSGDYDEIVAGDGDDVLLDGDGVRKASGGAGNDLFVIVLRNGWRDGNGAPRFTGLTAGYGNDLVSLTSFSYTRFFLELSGDGFDKLVSPLEGVNDYLAVAGVIDPASNIIKFEQRLILSAAESAGDAIPSEDAGAAYLTEAVGEENGSPIEQATQIFLPLITRY